MEPKDLLIADLEYVRGSFWKSEEIGEKRFGFFVTVVTAVVAGLIALYTKDALPKADLVETTKWILLGLLVFGFLTYVRMLQRNATSDGYKKMSDETWRAAKALCPELAQYELNFGKKSGMSKWLRAGLAETIGLINGALLGALLVFSFEIYVPSAVVAGMIAAAIPWWVSTRRT